jgi:penicillin-binding protein 1A
MSRAAKFIIPGKMPKKPGIGYNTSQRGRFTAPADRSPTFEDSGERMKLGRQRRSARERRSEKAHRRRIIILIAVLVVIPIIAAGFFGATLLLGLQAVASVQTDIPSLSDQHQVSLAETSSLYAADGTLLAYLHGVENRTVISGKQIPQVLRNAVVAIEDERFYSHQGVDFESFVRALVTNINARSTTEGFSTITMQLVGNLYLDRTDMSFKRKFDEMALAWQLERRYSKNEILDLYLNSVYFGSNAYGVEAAAKTYFNKEPAALTIAEAALIAGLPQAPTGYSPRKHLDKALERRNRVISKMAELGFITQGEADAALLTPIELAPYSPYTQVQEPYVVAYVRKQLIDMFGEEKVFQGGLQVETTINPAYQKLAAEAISSTLNKQGDPSSALVSIESDTGYIRAMVGGTDYSTSKFNLASQGRRQAGSAFKTFCLAAAIEMGIDPWRTYYMSMPVELNYPGATQPWKVKTYSGKGYGISTLVQATLRSDNTVYAQLALDVGADRIVDIAHRMGITSYLNSNPAIVLGGLTYGVSPLEMASAYETLANKGQHVEPTIILRIKDSSGKVIWQANPKRTQAISSGVAYDVTQILQQNIQKGTGTKADIGRPAAGKTGTTQDNADAWFCGYTPHLSTAVWVGFPQGLIPMNDIHGNPVTGGGFPAEIWQKFMNLADRDYVQTDFVAPTVKVVYDPFFRSTYAAWPSSTTTKSTTTTTLPPETLPPVPPPTTTPATTGPPQP